MERWAVPLVPAAGITWPRAARPARRRRLSPPCHHVVTSPSPPPTSLPRHSPAEQVYDVTTYVEHHPGGDAIFAHAGGDCTEGFRGPQHPPTVWDLVAEYCIGWVEEE